MCRMVSGYTCSLVDVMTQDLSKPQNPQRHAGGCRLQLTPRAGILTHDVSKPKPAQMKAAGATTSHHWGTHRRMSGAVDSAPGGYYYT